MRKGVFVLVGTVLLFGSSSASALTIYSTEVAYLAALTTLGPKVTFEDRPAGTILAGNEYAASDLLFDGLATPPPPTGDGTLNIGGPAFFATSNYLNIDEVPFTCCDGQNDSLEVTILGNWKAIGMQFIDGFVPSAGESIVVYDQNDNVLLNQVVGSFAYFGVIADANIGRVVINEAEDDSDDIGYDNFQLGNAGPAVPEPASLSLFALGAIGLARRRRSRKL